MALTAQLMASMDDGHLLAAIDAELDPITSTDIERELVKRLESLLDDKARVAKLLTVLDDLGLEDDEIQLLADTFSDFSLNDVVDMRTKLERADKFYDIAQEAGDVITRLNDLVNTTL